MTRFASRFLCLISLVSAAYAQTPPPDFLLDLNGDGAIDSKDLLILIQRWGLQGIATPSPTQTFAPTSTHTPTLAETATETPTPASVISLDLPLPNIRMVLIPAGTFMMGSPDTERSRNSNEGPVHEVTIDHDFYIGETEVTQLQWQSVMGYNASTHTRNGTPIEGDNGVGSDYPVYFVSWNDCQDFIAALNTLGLGTFRLPTEAEWEYACRSGTSSRFYFGNTLGCPDVCEDCDTLEIFTGGKHSQREEDIDVPKIILLEMRSDFMWFCGSGVDKSRPVRSLFPNAFDLYDMSGNVSEWVQDNTHPDYTGAPADGSAWESGESSRVYRGGDWVSTAGDCRSARRQGLPASISGLNIGFRLARDL